MNISEIISSLFKRFRYGTRLDPGRDWLTLLILSTVILIGTVVWNAWAFDTIASGGIIGTSATSTPAVFSQSSLDTINTIFANRADEKAKYETGTYGFADPSQ